MCEIHEGFSQSNNAPMDIIIIISAYLLGSISSAIISCKLLNLPDPRSLGSGNPGTTNVLRTGNKKAAAITLIGDALKGFLPVLLATKLSTTPLTASLAGLAAFLGHVFPIFFKFQGGKGVATFLGVLHAWHWPTGLLVDLVWLITARCTQQSSPSSLVALFTTPFLLALFASTHWPTAAVLFILTLITHRQNIIALIQKQERKL